MKKFICCDLSNSCSILSFLIAVLFASTLFAAETPRLAVIPGDRHNEAKRFFDEAVFLAGLENYEPALERIDAAVALDYDSIRYRNKQAWLLLQYALYQMHPDLARVIHSAPNGYPPVKQESLETALLLVRRAVDVIESIPGSFLGESVDGEVLERLSHTNRILAGMIWTFTWSTLEPPKSLFPEYYENVNRLLDYISEVWEKTYDEVAANVNDASSFAKYCRYWEPIAPLHQTPKIAHLYEKLIGDLIRFTEQWQDVKESTAARTGLCRQFAYFAADFKIAREYILVQHKGTQWGREIEASIARTCQMLDSAFLAEFGIYSYLAQNGLEFSSNQNSPSLKDLTKTDMLKRQIASLPQDMNKNDTLTLFNEAALRCFFNTDHVASVSDFIDFVELANERKTPTGHLTKGLLSCLDACYFFHAKNKPEKLIDLRNNLERYFKAVEFQIELADVKSTYSPEYLEKLLNCSRANWNQLVTERPWKEEVLIWTRDYHYDCLNYVYLHEDTLFLFVFGWEREFWNIRIDEFDCKNRIYQKGDTTPFKRSRDYLGNELNDIKFERDSACVDARNIFYGTYGEGIFVIPRDSSAPWRLTEEDGLPSNHVQAMAVMNGKLYVGLGRDNQESWLVSVDIETRKVSILASSASIEDHPFSNCSPAPMYIHFELDPKRNRLLMLVRRKSLGNIEGGVGLWTLNGNTNALNHHFQFYLDGRVGITGHILPDSDQFLINDSWLTFLIDIDRLDTGLASVQLVGIYGDYYSIHSIHRSMRSHISQQTGQAFGMKWGTVWNGEFWGGVTFNDKTLRKRYGDNPYFMRASLANKDDFEFLSHPGGKEVSGWQQAQFCYTVNGGKDLIFGNYSEVFLLRFE